MKENKMKKLACTCIVALLSLSTLVGCSFGDTSNSENVNSIPMGKVVINFEGTVTEVNADEVTLENGKTIVISSDTVFAGDPDTNNAVSDEIAVGNFIQGYTEDDPNAEKIFANKIYCNVKVQPGGGKIVINFEGKITAVEDNLVTLESGQVILVTEDTVFSIASGIVENVILLEGYNIQGYTENESTASRIHIITY